MSIIIKEFDLTKAGINSNYANFSVVIPGFAANLATEKAAKTLVQWKVEDGGDGCYYYYETATSVGVKVFDENGIYECASQSDFVKYVGCCINENKVCATITELKDEAGNFRKPTEEEFNGKYENQVYKWEIITDESQKVPGKFIVHNAAGWFKLTEVLTEYAQVEANLCAVCEKGNEGSDNAAIQYGNEIAYLLLGLGYTVVYKLLENIDDLSKDEYWEPLQDKATYDFRYVINGLMASNSAANTKIANLAAFSNQESDQNRGDCNALVDIDYELYKAKMAQKDIIEALRSGADTVCSWNAYNGKYTAICANPVSYEIEDDNIKKYYNGNLTFPAYMHYLVCNAKSLASFAEWYAVSGYTRGTCSFKITGTAKKLGEVAIRALQPRNNDAGTKRSVNLIVKVKDAYYFWGNRTAHELESSMSTKGDLVASHFLNIRQLCTTIKKQLFVTCRRYTFDPNTDTLWFNFTSEITPLLEKMKADQGIRDYRLFKVKSKQKAKMTAVLRIVPIEAVEDFEINMYLEDSIDGNLNINFEE